MAPRRIVLAIVGLLMACGIAGVFADRWVRARAAGEARRSVDAATGETRARALGRIGEVEGAEARYWAILQEGPATVPILVLFLESHQSAVEAAATLEADAAGGNLGRLRIAPVVPAVSEASIDAFLALPELPPGVALLGRYWRGIVRSAPDRAVEREVVRVADLDPPTPYANELLAREALNRGRPDEAAERFLREGTYFRDRAVDVSIALEHWMNEEAWDRIDQALADPRVASVATPWLQLRSAIRLHDWRAAARAYPRCIVPPLSAGSTVLALISALAWGIFCARLGGISMRFRVRLPLYLAAFVLGVASVSLTLLFVVLEDVFLKMSETGDPMRDLLFYTFGVGFREEVSKLLFFAALLPFLRRHGTRLDVLVCGAIVGLGFASEENLGYLHQGDLSTAMARFLTANFFHMAMTAILAGALDSALGPHTSASVRGQGWGTGAVWVARGREDEEDGSLRFSRVLLTVAMMHGIYDFCLSSRAFGNISYFSMGVFLLLTRQFLALVSAARAKERAVRPRLLETFAFGMAVVVGTSFVYASALVGPGPAAAALAEGLLGLAIIIFIFVQELRRV